jgi:glycosyltransferase involved in cell wall biosynthesis
LCGRVAAQRNQDVTVVISCFNYGRFLPEAISSVTEQDGGPARIIVVDDGSDDPATQRVVAELERDPEIVVVRQDNAGASAARNTGLRLVDTPYALVLDADDVLPRDAIVRLRAALEDDPRAGYAYGHIEFFGGASGVMRFPPFDPWRLMFRHIVGPTALMRREVVQATGGYDVDFPHYEDWEIWLHALAEGWPGTQVDFCGLLQRKHGPSKFAGDRADYRRSFARLRRKHRRLYGRLNDIARSSTLNPAQRFLYRYVWGLRPWPERAETALYSIVWRRRDHAVRSRDMTTIAR